MTAQAKYMTERIISGKLDYTLVISKRPDLKEDVDFYLKETGNENLIK